MLPVLFGENLFDDFFDDSFERELRAMNRNPLYGKHGRNLMSGKTATTMNLPLTCPALTRTRSRWTSRTAP